MEIHCHGGSAAVSLVMEALEQAGAKRCDSARLADREHASGDPLAGAALLDLARAPTIRTAEILLDQAHGALRQEIVRICGAIGPRTDAALAGLDVLSAARSSACGFSPGGRL